MNWTISIYLLDELDKWAFITQVADLVLCRNFSASLQTVKSVAIRQLRGMVPQLGWTEMQQLEKISDAGKCTTILVKL